MSKILILVFVLLVSVSGNGQKILPAVQQGHFNDVNRISLNENEEILTSFGADGQTIQWELKSGMQLNRKIELSVDLPLVTPKVFGWGTSSEDTSIIRSGDTVYQTSGPVMTVLINGKILAERTTQYYDKGFSKIVTNVNSKYVFGSSIDGIIYVYDKKNFKQVKLLRTHHSSVNDIIITSNGKSLFSASSDRTIIEWEVPSLTFKRRFHGYSFRITALAFGADGKSILLGNEIGELKKFNLENYSQSLENHTASNHPITDIIPYTNKKDTLFRIVSLDNQIQTLNPKKSKFTVFKKYHRLSWKQSQQKVFEDGLGIYLDPSFEKVILDYNESQTSYVHTGNEIKGRLRRKLIFKNEITGKRKVIRSDWNKVDEMTVINDTLIAVLKQNDASAAMMSAQEDARLTLWKIKKKKLYSYETKIGMVNSIASYKDRFLFILKNDSLIIWDIQKNIIQRNKLNSIMYSGNKIWIKNDHCLIGDFANQIHLYEIAEGNEIKYKGKFSGHEGRISSLDISPSQNLIATGSYDATIRFWSLDSLQHLGTMIPVGRMDFILLAPTGEYQITKKAFQKFGFSSGTEFIYPAQFDLRFNMPHIVLKSIGIGNEKGIQMLENAYLKRLKRMGFENNTQWNDENSLPEIKIISQEKTGDSKMKIAVEAMDETYHLDRINLFVNDVPVYGSKGFSLSESKVKEWKNELMVDLINGKNKIEISVLNSNGVESLRKTVLVEENEMVKSDLYVIAFGASDYADKNHNLTYPEKDANDMTTLLKENKKAVFNNVFTKTITNKKFTKESLEECKTFLKDAKTQDVVIVFVAGHGVLDKNLDYYLATHDMDFSNPSEKGLPYEELESLLDGIAPLKKVLFLDACHSGEVDKEEVELLATNTTINSKVKFRNAGAGIQKKNLGLKTTSELMGELFTDLRRGTGATVISSAGGAEYAMESDEWKNGLFTYCLLHGLQDKAADENKDGQIMLSELQNYLRKEVTSLSNGAQQPTSRIENLSMDFRVW